ncbi:MAG: hypothetical protein R6W66_07090 [Pelovirga sp.]
MDFLADPPKKFFRLAPGREVRLRNSYIIRCDEMIRDEHGQLVELRCTADLATLGRNPADGRKVKGIIHWVSARHAQPVEIRLYDRLFRLENPDKAAHYLDALNPDSLRTVTGLAEPSLLGAIPGETFQFERVGYFTVDSRAAQPQRPVFNRTVTLRDTWEKIREE